MRSEIKLHLGCGGIRLEGYTNIDAIRTGATDIVLDLSSYPLPYPDESVSSIVCSHMLEHLSKAEAQFLLKEMHRVLKKEAVLHLEIPVVDRIFEKLKDQHELLINSLYGMQRNLYDCHKYGYTEKTISTLLTSIGFSVKEVTLGRTNYGKDSPGIILKASKS